MTCFAAQDALAPVAHAHMRIPRARLPASVRARVLAASAGSGDTLASFDGAATMAAMLRLTPHPDFPCTAVVGIEAEASRPGSGLLALRYVLRGALADVGLPQPAPSLRADELWRHTCFEAFVSTAGGDDYRELNLAPSTAWAAYRFDGYREGMRPAQIEAPTIEVRRSADTLELAVLVDLPDLPKDAAWRVGLCTVVEETNGARSYWALAHPPGKPDFHNRDCFALELAGSGNS